MVFRLVQYFELRLKKFVNEQPFGLDSFKRCFAAKLPVTNVLVSRVYGRT